MPVGQVVNRESMDALPNACVARRGTLAEINILDASPTVMEEVQIKQEASEKEITCLATGETDLKDDTKKCGEVLVGSHGNFTLVCVLCTQCFPNLHSFGSHIHSQHVELQTYTSTVEEAPFVPNNPHIKKEHATRDDLSTSTPTSETHNAESLDRDSDHIEELYDEEIDPNYNLESKTTDNPGISNAAGKSSTAAPIYTMTCKFCDRIFTEVDKFREHLSTHTGRKKFVCPHCPKTFTTRKCRQSHINTHTGERPHKCSYCPKAFAERGNLVMHERAHLGIKKYSCAYCDKRFVQATEKKLHERRHTGEKPYQCEECGKQFVAQVKLTEHTKRHKNIRNYKCQHCDKAFVKSDSLARHMPVHTKERPFNCKVCGQNFPRQWALRTHMELHSTEKKYVCTVCDKAFRQFAGLYSHKKSHAKTPG